MDTVHGDHGDHDDHLDHDAHCHVNLSELEVRALPRPLLNDEWWVNQSLSPLGRYRSALAAKKLDDENENLISFASLIFGKGTSGTGTWRNWQSGVQPSFTSNTSSCSGGTVARTWAIFLTTFWDVIDINYQDVPPKAKLVSKRLVREVGRQKYFCGG